jgi:hypothetical protein
MQRFSPPCTLHKHVLYAGEIKEWAPIRKHGGRIDSPAGREENHWMRAISPKIPDKLGMTRQIMITCRILRPSELERAATQATSQVTTRLRTIPGVHIDGCAAGATTSHWHPTFSQRTVLRPYRKLPFPARAGRP